MKKIAWHYTVGARMGSILESGEIRAATLYVPKGEIPIVWFSTRSYWEPTANKALLNERGEIVSLGFEQTILHGGGGWRFGISVDQLIP